jgi:hypothetical protein
MFLTTDSTHLQDDHQRVPIVQHGPRRLRHNRRAQTSSTEAEVTMAILDLPSTPPSDTNNRDPRRDLSSRLVANARFIPCIPLSPRSRPVSILFPPDFPFSRYKFGINKIPLIPASGVVFLYNILSTYPRLATILLHSLSAFLQFCQIAPSVRSRIPVTYPNKV